jgi:hypothetical protein
LFDALSHFTLSLNLRALNIFRDVTHSCVDFVFLVFLCFGGFFYEEAQ